MRQECFREVRKKLELCRHQPRDAAEAKVSPSQLPFNLSDLRLGDHQALITRIMDTSLKHFDAPDSGVAGQSAQTIAYLISDPNLRKVVTQLQAETLTRTIAGVLSAGVGIDVYGYTMHVLECTTGVTVIEANLTLTLTPNTPKSARTDMNPNTDTEP